MFHLLDLPPYSEFTKSQEAAASTSGGGQQVGYIPAPGGGQQAGYIPAPGGGQQVGYIPAPGGGQQVGYVPAPGPPFYTTPSLQPVQQVVMSVYVIRHDRQSMEPLIEDPPR